MRRTLVGSLAVLLVTGTASAQPRGGARGPGMSGGVHAPPAGGGFRMIQAPPPPRTTGFGAGFGYYPGGVGLRGGYGYGGYGYGGYGYGGYGYGGYGGFISGGYAPYYVVPQPDLVVGGGGPSAPAVPADPSTSLAVSGILPATLVIQFPAPARVWLDGVEVPGDPDLSWTFTSRNLRPGETATFRVRGRWQAGGRTYESTREVALGPGARSRLLVVTGNEVAE